MTRLLSALAAAALAAAGSAQPPDAGATKHLDFTGRTEASATVVIRPRVTGELTRLHVKEGEAVKKGDLLAEIDARQFQLELDAAKARLLAVEAKLRVAEAALARVERAARAGIVPPEEFEQAKAAMIAERAEVAAAQAAAKLVELNLSYTKLTAPIDGVAGRHLVTAGNLVTAADKTAILTIVAADPLHVWFDVDERSIARLRPPADGKRAEVKVGFAGDDGFPHAAEIDLIEPVANPAAGTVRVRARLPNPKGQFVPGMFARVRVTPADGR
ncbi:efflux RND transporter periplasmic adaptor subunit [bacterium]|nr:efflux RND transporter periplasmic adaptor subunit [bacterium]